MCPCTGTQVSAGAGRGQRGWYALKLELRAVISHLLRVGAGNPAWILWEC